MKTYCTNNNIMYINSKFFFPIDDLENTVYKSDKIIKKN